MNYSGSCHCGKWKIAVSSAKPLDAFNPRVCDCEYCQSHPSALISDPLMEIELIGDDGHVVRNKNGDQLATFFHCSGCGDLLAVGCNIDGRLRGAVNALLLEQR